MANHRVGGDVDAYCTKCRMMLGHTIIAMVGEKIARVRCNTCQGQHTFRPNPPGTKTARTSAASPRAARPAREKVTTLPFEALFADRDTSTARTYSPKERFADEEILDHPTFGLGLVKAARHDKIDVIFKMGEKTLVHSLGGAKAVAFEKPGAQAAGSRGAADKPPPGAGTGLHAVNAPPPTPMPEKESDGA